MKVDTSGNILFWHQYQYPGAGVYNSQDVEEIPGKGYILAMNIDIGLTSYVLVIRTDTSGNVLNEVKYSISYDCWPKVIKPMYNGHYMIGAWSGPLNNNTPYQAHTWLIEVDSMGNHVRYWLDPDPTNLWPNDMEQTADSGWIIVRQHLAYDVSNFQEYNGSVLKLDKNFNKQWDIHIGDSSDLTGFNDIKILPDGKYIACGTTPTWGYDSAYYWGLLAKIDTNGSIIWERKYTAFAAFGAHSILNSLQYLDNGDIVACGQLELTFNVNGQASQQGWIIRTDSNGCLLDNCGRFGTEVDEVSNNPFTAEIFPNPSKNNFTIKLNIPPSNDVYINVYDLTGRLALRQALTQQTTTIQNQLNSGMYLWQVQSNSGAFSAGKLVIEN